MMELITVASFQTVTSAGIAKAYLESEGIECYVIDEFMGQILAGIGVRLQVKEGDAEKAVQLLKDGGYISA